MRYNRRLDGRFGESGKFVEKASNLRRTKASNRLSFGLLRVIINMVAPVAQKWGYLVRLQLGATAATYGVLVSAFLLFRFVFGEKSEIIALLNTIAPWIATGSAVGFGLSFLAPYRKYWLVWSVPGVIAFILWHGPTLIPGRPLMPPQTTDHFVVASFNFTLVNTVLSQDNRTAIEDLDADLLGLQEISGYVPLYELEDLFQYQFRDSGLAIVSKFPFHDEQVIMFEDADARERTVALRIIAEIYEQPVSIYVAHPERPTISVRPMTYDDRNLKRGMEALLEAIENEQNPVILLCDCNFAPTSESYSNMDKVLTDSWSVAGFGFGFTAPANKHDTPFPVIRGDYVWHSSEFATVDVEVSSNHGDSDHYPVRAELGWIVDD